MAEEYKKLLTRISQRSNTSDGWVRENPILYAGELGFELDTYRVKHGNGVSHWLELPYWSNDGLTYTQGDGIVINNNIIGAMLLYEKLKMPNVRIYCHDPNNYPVRLAISTSDGYQVFTDE